MKNACRLFLALALALSALPASAALSCSISTNPVEVKLIYNYFNQPTLTGAININCTRNPNQDSRQPWVWIGMNQANNGRNATLDTGGSTLNYEINHGSTTAGTWTDQGNGGDATSTTDGPVRERLDFGSNTASSLTESFTFYARVPFLQFRPAGVYVDTVTITMRNNNANGAILTTETLPIYLSIPRSCRFSTPPSAVAINYPAFSPTAVVGNSNFALTCTQGTTYTIALDAARGVVPNVNLSYGAALSATNSTGTAVAQPYTVTITVDPGQAGRCTGGVCTGMDSRTLTVTY